MTDQELRKLDAEIAERVMGWSIVETDDLGSCWRDHENKTLYRLGSDQLPHFSDAIEAAWEVVEELSPMWGWIAVSKRSDGQYVCGMGRVGVVQPDIGHVADTAPLAICLAALKAAEEK